jgi:hypothetical protein
MEMGVMIFAAVAVASAADTVLFGPTENKSNPRSITMLASLFILANI